ncbi:uncharacterized protein BX664DRAFT_385051 [Halteromyces radiatus]|uniref:uncharacterized protein n=1 Tax=Halteromyces radiatus TaxID=101107 RepID=UPI0022204426|nr:uncharacterized protein BX664DRAFT_385051 [Halteromyces radiatus]KAI8093653.1 hypothetical protein BX664DRAFT_385051 [Halteromyces radiatus]
MDSDEYDSSNSRRSSLAISALLNDDSVDPITSTRLTPEEKRENRKTWPGFLTEDAPKAKRKRISTQQFNRLMAIFQQTDTPSSEVREHLAEELDMTKREVQVWFQNRRAKASRARAAAAAISNANHNNDHHIVNNMTIRYDQPSPSFPTFPPSPPILPAIQQQQQRQPVISYTPPPPRRASFASSLPPTRPSSSSSISSSSLQPIAPMPPPSTQRPLSANAAITPIYPTSHVQSIAPRKHSIHQGFENLSLQHRDRRPAKKRPKSVIELYKNPL